MGNRFRVRKVLSSHLNSLFTAIGFCGINTLQSTDMRGEMNQCQLLRHQLFTCPAAATDPA